VYVGIRMLIQIHLILGSGAPFLIFLPARETCIYIYIGGRERESEKKKEEEADEAWRGGGRLTCA
jgi:hypothetical protein